MNSSTRQKLPVKIVNQPQNIYLPALKHTNTGTDRISKLPFYNGDHRLGFPSLTIYPIRSGSIHKGSSHPSWRITDSTSTPYRRDKVTFLNRFSPSKPRSAMSIQALLLLSFLPHRLTLRLILGRKGVSLAGPFPSRKANII